MAFCTLFAESPRTPSGASVTVRTTLGGTSAGYCLYVTDCDAVFAQAVAAGATQVRPLADQFYGDRSGTVADPFGHSWTIATHTKDMTAAEMQTAMDEWVKSMPSA